MKRTIPVTDKRWYRIHLLVVLVGTAILFGGIGESRTEPQKTNAVHIISDRLEAYQQERRIVFLGHVVATDEDLSIRADRMTIFYLDQDGVGENANSPAELVDRIVIEGNVRISQGERFATGDRAVYSASENKFVLTGGPSVRQGKDVIKGSSITLFLDSKRSIVEGGPSGPVEAFISSPGGLGGSFDRDSGAGTSGSGTDREEGGQASRR